MSKAAVINFPLIVKQESCFPCHYPYKAQPLYKAPIRTQTPHLKENKAKQPQKKAIIPGTTQIAPSDTLAVQSPHICTSKD